ncbi:MAG: LLM class F420-dependent oxidoreductase [Chromatiales bacterium]|jgi:F420-dependent oxidoreductase-like protein|nr:LLM class F420-dependent oxidoreductase [Chromatiales bacterium]
MQFALKTPPQHCEWNDMLDIWRTADAIEAYTSAWNFDHFYPLVGEATGPCMEAWVTLTALAANTKRIRIGCMVNAVPYRHPALIANMAATLDIVSQGRLDLGLGAGWHAAECAAYGIDLLPMKQRMDRFEEAVNVVVSLLSNDTTQFDGTYYQLSNARCEPKGPQQPRPPIVIGGGGEKRTLRIAAQFADHWNLSFPTPETFTHKRSVLRAHCETIGRNLSDIQCSAQIALPADKDPEAVVAQAAALGEAGADMVLFSMRPPYRADMVEKLALALEEIST